MGVPPNVSMERWDFREVLQHDGGALTNGVSALMKETPDRSLPPPTMRGHGSQPSTPRRGFHLDPTVLVP